MAKITSRTDLNVGTEILIDESAKTITLVGAGNLTPKDGVTIQAIYSKLVDLWSTLEYQDSPFPMNALDAKSGQYQVGIDAGGNANGWKPANDTTRQMMRDGGWEEYDATGDLLRVYVGIVGLGSVSSGSQPYYQTTAAAAPTNFTFDDQCNEGIQVYGNAANGNFDSRSFFKTFVREQGKKFSDSELGDTGNTGTNAYIVNMLLSNEDDLKISDNDGEMANAPYSGISVSYYGSNQSRNIGGSDYNFTTIINGAGATLEEIYTKVQYLLRQASDINASGDVGSVIGQTADLLCGFVGDNLETTFGVFIDNVAPADSNRVSFKDVTGTDRTNPYTAAGSLSFNSVMIQAGSSYRLMYATPDGSDNDYGEVGAITVNDAGGTPITGVITSGTIDFTFDYDNDAAAAAGGTDKDVVLIGIAPNYSKFAVAEGTLTRSKAISLGLVAEVDRAYL